MVNSETNTTTICDPDTYKYVKLLLKDLESSRLNESRQLITSDDIESDYLSWKNISYFWKKKMRIQIVDQKMFVSSTHWGIERHIYDKEGYRVGLFFYLCELMRKYAAYLPNTDFILYHHDYKQRKMVNQHNLKRCRLWSPLLSIWSMQWKDIINQWSGMVYCQRCSIHIWRSNSDEKLKKITENSNDFIDKYLLPNNIDCFFIQMIQIYNAYLFDVASVYTWSDENMRQLPIDLN